MTYYLFGASVFAARMYASDAMLDDDEWVYIDPYNRETEWLLLSTDWRDATMVVVGSPSNLQTFRILAYCEREGATLHPSAEKWRSAIDHYGLDDLQWFD